MIALLLALFLRCVIYGALHYVLSVCVVTCLLMIIRFHTNMLFRCRGLRAPVRNTSNKQAEHMGTPLFNAAAPGDNANTGRHAPTALQNYAWSRGSLFAFVFLVDLKLSFVSTSELSQVSLLPLDSALAGFPGSSRSV